MAAAIDLKSIFLRKCRFESGYGYQIMNDCGGQKIERVEYNGQKAYRITETIGSYVQQATLVVEHYTRTKPAFDYMYEKIL